MFEHGTCILGSAKSAAIQNIKLVARENGEGGGHKLSEEDVKKLELKSQRRTKNCVKITMPSNCGRKAKQDRSRAKSCRGSKAKIKKKFKNKI